MTTINIEPTRKVTPKCYAYTTPEIRKHDGWTKIGFTEQADVHARIRQQTQTADVKYHLEWLENAIYDSGEAFRDSDFHAYLRKQSVEHLKTQYQDKYGQMHTENTEWFRILPEVAHEKFKDFKANRGILKTLGCLEYRLRKEQDRAVEQTRQYFLANRDKNPEFLWNAKPRFGKTLATYDLCKRLDAKTVLIVTNRPAIANSWYEDYVKYLGTDSGYYFISSAEALKGKPHVIARKDIPTDVQGYIEFVSLQDLKGSIYFGGRYKKLEEVAEINWDILVIDEAHEAIDTTKTDVAFDQIKRKYTLHLSGTPFKALANDKFKTKAIYNWTYADEQKAKQEWDYSQEGENPYASLPKLNLYTYQMSELIQAKLDEGADFDHNGENEEYAFDLNEFFATDKNGNFKYDEAVDQFFDALTHGSKFQFSTPELRDGLKHTFWLLNRVSSAKALKEKLKNHPIFKDYKIILAAGKERADGDFEVDNDELKKSYDKVVKAIKEYPKTITLSVGQLTTGITIPEWTAVLMLSNVKSPSLYIQAAFRAQNPCLFKYNGSLYRKENAYVFDFDPARTLVIFEQLANGLTFDTSRARGDTALRKKHIRELINFFPVYGEDKDGEMVALDAEQVLSIPRTIHAQEVVKRGFMSNFLFQNIGNIFSAPKEIRDIITKLNPAKEPLPIDAKTKDKLHINDDGEVEMPDEIIVGRHKSILGDKMYRTAEDAIEEAFSEISSNETAGPLEILKRKIRITIITPLLDKAKESFGKDLTKSVQNAALKKINDRTEDLLGKACGEFTIKRNKLEYKRKEALAQATTTEAKKAINKKYDYEIELAKQSLFDSVHAQTETLVREAEKTLFQETETNRCQKKKKVCEDTTRDYLRGFCRTIPSFLMAYGTKETKLENFDTIAPAPVFKEVTSITLDQFKMLRDGGDFINESTGLMAHFEGHFFDPIVFNDSVQEFLALKLRLANYFEDIAKEDIFDYIPPQKTNQIFTPKKLVQEMVDNLEKECPGCFDDPTKTFIDLYMKSGLYITEIVKRLYNSPKIKSLFPDKQARLRHIFEHQVYGLAPTENIYRIATAYILGFDYTVTITKHNLRQWDALKSIKQDTLEKDLAKLFPEMKSVKQACIVKHD